MARALTPTDLAAEPTAALTSLLAGNRRFATGRPRHGHRHTEAGREPVQRPYALLLGCLDSRVVPESIFDLDFGEVMVVRTGGHVIDAAVLGSIDFAVNTMRVPLLMVLGHQYCGAVAVTISALREGTRPTGPIGYLADQIAPAVGELVHGTADVVDEVVRRHVAATVDRLSALSLVQNQVQAGALAVVGAHYQVDNGQVDLVPATT